ncbi:MAG TPA: hypothetical protein VK742_07345 [Candidatus Sulfotelmatobacter sp.]|jgi:hypothetical protein|nr:hypothetical protein [Candidatus Sulfotelmatobacter sp.]
MTTNSSDGNYRHTQPGTLIRRVTLGIAVALIAAGWFTGHLAPMLVSGTMLLIIAWLFHSLTIEITGGELIWFFGPGLIHKRVPLSDIVSAMPAKNGPSWGIHWSPRSGWLYNVSGFDAVLVTLRGEKKFMLGTDEPSALAEAIRSQVK